MPEEQQTIPNWDEESNLTYVIMANDAPLGKRFTTKKGPVFDFHSKKNPETPVAKFRVSQMAEACKDFLNYTEEMHARELEARQEDERNQLKLFDGDGDGEDGPLEQGTS